MIRAALVLVLLLFCAGAAAHDPTAHAQMSPEMRGWFGTLKSKGKSLCCSLNDGYELEDDQWDIGGKGYRVVIDGKWMDVPDSTVIGEPNKHGKAWLWLSKDTDAGTLYVRCFMPGTEW